MCSLWALNFGRGHPRQAAECCLTPAERPRVLVVPPPTSLGASCIPEVHQRLFTLRLDLWALAEVHLVRRDTSIDVSFGHDVVFVMDVAQGETKMKLKNEKMKPKHASPVACLSLTAKLIRSLRENVQIFANGDIRANGYTFMKRANVAHDFTDMSLLLPMMTCRRMLFLSEFVGQVLRDLIWSYASRRIQGGAMSRDDNVNDLDVNREHCVGWHHACTLSNNDLNPVASGIHKRLSNCWE